MYHQTLRKEDGSLPEIGAEPTQTSNMRTVLVDKGYQGAGLFQRIVFSLKISLGGCACSGKQPKRPSSGVRTDLTVLLDFAQP
ncbi:hypothetical protein L915_17004 [Phytophthora nicotianae]|uniref:Uncharacterized protein n=1 Tax=Phytophthora nicotianae TaxID=4792 RepID=W2G2W7_PHYNI|nr:hypothetical protein L915_17004 [Phytophthora nicotianae]